MQLRPVLFFLTVLLFYFPVSAQITVVTLNDTLTPSRVVKEYFLGTGVQVNRITFRGEPQALGVFSDPKGYAGITEGIILSTGLAEHLKGPNARPNSGANFGRYSFVDDDLVTQNNMCDGAALEFDFVPRFDSIVFDFVFGSEEYPEFVGKEFNDLFAFYLNQKLPTRGKVKNIGSLPNGTTVTINNVNHKRNSEWYIPNDQPNDPNYDHIEYDGYTHVITARAKVTPMHTYHLKIIIADLGDCEYDSGVLLRARSFSSIPSAAAVKPVRVVNKIFHLNFGVDAWTLDPKEQWKVKKVADSMAIFRLDSIVVLGHTDSTGSRNLVLSQRRAETVKEIVESRLEDKNVKVRAYGKGSAHPLAPNSTEEGRALNRRVEILFYQRKR